MDAAQVNTVIDKLADKLGVAADKLRPLGEQAIREFQRQAVAGAVTDGLLLVGFGLALALCARTLLRNVATACDEDEQASPPAVVRCVVSAILGMISAIGLLVCVLELPGDIRCAFSPTYHCLLALLRS